MMTFVKVWSMYVFPWETEIKQMQPMQLCFFSGRQFEEAFENTQSLMLPGEINISQLQGKIEFNTFFF